MLQLLERSGSNEIMELDKKNKGEKLKKNYNQNKQILKPKSQCLPLIFKNQEYGIAQAYTYTYNQILKNKNPLISLCLFLPGLADQEFNYLDTKIIIQFEFGMSSRIDSSKSKEKTKRTQIAKYHYPSPNQKQFIAYSQVKKETGSGIFGHNKRIILLDTLQLTLRYYSKLPESVLMPGSALPEGKDIVFIKKVKNFIFKPANNGIYKVTVRWEDLKQQKGKVQKQWIFTFENKILMEEWVVMVNQVLKQGHRNPELRPKSISRTPQSNQSKYETQFMKSTGGRSKIYGSSMKAQSDISNQQYTLGAHIEKKQGQMMSVHNQIHNIQGDNRERDNREKGDSQRIKKIDNSQQKQKYSRIMEHYTPTTPTIQQVDNQSKFSNLSANQARQNVTDLHINRTPMPIQQNEEQQQTVVNIPLVEQHNSNKRTYQNEKVLDQHHRQIQIANLENGQAKKQNKANLVDSKSENIISIIFNSEKKDFHPSIQKRNQAQNNWGANQYYPYKYHQFLETCIQNCSFLSYNLAYLRNQAIKSPSSSLYIEEDDLIMIKSSITFSVNSKPNASYFSCRQRMSQYSTMIQHINRIKKQKQFDQAFKNKNIQIVPFCYIEYSQFIIECKAIVNRNYKIMQQREAGSMDNMFMLPKKIWQYYKDESSILIDIVYRRSKIESAIDEKTILNISQLLYRQDVKITHIEDLLQFVSINFEVFLTPDRIIQIYRKLFLINPKSPSASALLSIIFSIFCYDQISLLIQTDLFNLSITEIEEKVQFLCESICFHGNSQINSKLIRQFSAEFEKYDFPTIYIETIQANWVFCSLIELLGLELSINKRAKFKCRPFHFRIQSFCQQMKIIYDTIRTNLMQSWNEQKSYQGFLKVKDNLKQFQFDWNESIQSNSQKDTRYQSLNLNKRRFTFQENYGKKQTVKKAVDRKASSLHKYLNLYFFIYYYQSLYVPYSQSYLSLEAQYPKEIQKIISMTPPNYLSYQISINCIKWVSKGGLQSYTAVSNMINEQILSCLKWNGEKSQNILELYELAAVYNQQLFHINKAIQYGKSALVLVNSIYGDWSIEAAQRWFLLGNIIMEDSDLYQQAIQSFQKSLIILQESQSLKFEDRGRYSESNLKLSVLAAIPSYEAQLTIRFKLLKLQLAVKNIPQCINEALKCLDLFNEMANVDEQKQFDVYSVLIRCFQITKEAAKLLTMIQNVCRKLGQSLRFIIPNGGKTELDKYELMRQQILKSCLSPSIKFRIKEPHRKLYLLKLTQKVREKYENRYNKKECNSYINKQLIIQLEKQYSSSYEIPQRMGAGFKKQSMDSEIPNEDRQKCNVIEWFMKFLEELSLFKYMGQGKGLLKTEIQYTFFQSNFNTKIQPVTQNKLLIPTLRAIQAVSGIIGYSYLIACFSSP